MKALALGLFTTFATVASAQSNDNDGKLLADASITKTEIFNNNIMNPVVREGKATDALIFSENHKLLVVYISGAKGTADKPEKYTAHQYGQILQKAFANPKYTDNPTDIVVFYKESSEEGPSTASVYINGDVYTTKSGRTVFTPMIVGSGIDRFADAYALTKPKTKTAFNAPKSENGLVINNE